jgi:hypothetical protein
MLDLYRRQDDALLPARTLALDHLRRRTHLDEDHLRVAAAVRIRMVEAHAAGSLGHKIGGWRRGRGE